MLPFGVEFALWAILDYPPSGRDPCPPGGLNKANTIQAAPGIISCQTICEQAPMVFHKTINPKCCHLGLYLLCGRYWIRTSDPLLVRQVL